MIRSPAAAAVLVAALIMLAARPAEGQLRADQLALIVNANEPAGKAIADFYVAQRHVPADRILTLDLPTGDEITPKEYAERVVPQVRAFLGQPGVNQQVRCLVPVYGVPLRIGQRHNSPAEQAEFQAIQVKLSQLPDRMGPAVNAVETLARRLDPTFVAQGQGQTLADIDRRWTAAVRAVTAQLPTIPDSTRRATVARQLFAAAIPMLGDAADVSVAEIDLQLHPDRRDIDGPALQAKQQQYQLARAAAAKLEATPEDAAARDALRRSAEKQFGLSQYARLLQDQLDYMDEAHGPAAVDQELSLVRFLAHPHNYPGGNPRLVGGAAGRPIWFPNPLSYANDGRPTPALMVCRLDGPSPAIVKAMIATSIKVEQRGLRGKVVIDSLGYLPGREPEGKRGYGTFDQTLRELRQMLRSHRGIDVVFDDKEAVLPPGSANNVALYCGWYAVNGYVPSCTFAGGAVGMHVASYTLTTLRPTGQPNWAAGLLGDGCVATIGPVAEPFLTAFPRPDDFFPLLMTGRLTLAECYWRTCPIAAWEMVCVGDPLYTPYKVDPQLAERDLPLRLRVLFQPAIQPTTRP